MKLDVQVMTNRNPEFNAFYDVYDISTHIDFRKTKVSVISRSRIIETLD